MRKLMIVPFFAAIALSGCGGSAPEAERNVTIVNSEAEADAAGNLAQGDNAALAGGGNAIAKVIALNDAQRNGVFYRALEDAGLVCQKVTSSERMPDMDGKPLWRANCDSKLASASTSHMITITPDGTAQIVSRTDR